MSRLCKTPGTEKNTLQEPNLESLICQANTVLTASRLVSQSPALRVNQSPLPPTQTSRTQPCRGANRKPQSKPPVTDRLSLSPNIALRLILFPCAERGPRPLTPPSLHAGAHPHAKTPHKQNNPATHSPENLTYGNGSNQRWHGTRKSVRHSGITCLRGYSM